MHEGPELAANGEYRVIDCAGCGFAHVDPLPAEDELAARYGGGYYEDDHPGQLAKDRAERAFWALEHADRMDDWSALGAQGAVVDVGCSGGLLLESLAAAGWTAWGIEPSAAAVEECRRLRLEVVHGRWQDVVLEEEVGVVHARLVLEHLHDPAAFVAWARRALRPGGVLTLHVPNDFNPLQLAARDALRLHAWWVAPPFHLNHFTFASLERLVAAGGLVPAGRDATYPMEWFLLAGEDYVRDPAVGASAHGRRMLLEAHLEAAGERRPLHAALAARGLGREAIVHAVRR